MRRKIFAAALALVSAVMISGCNDQKKLDYPEASDNTSLDKSTGVLTISGNVTKEDIQRYRKSTKVKGVVAAEDCVLPEDCSELFHGGNYTDNDNQTAAYWSILGSVDLSKADASNVKSMSNMFSDCEKLTVIDISGFDTSAVTDMSQMFSDCCELVSVDVSGFDTSNVTDMGGMFEYCKNLTELDVTGFDTSKVKDMSSLFCGCEYLYEADVSGFDTANVTDMSNMFAFTKLEDLDLTGFDTSNVKDMSQMFMDCDAIPELDLTGFDTSNVRNMFKMFSMSDRLETIYVSDKWSMENIDRAEFMFLYCPALTGDKGTTYNEEKTGGEFACIDTDETEGYFSVKE